MLTGGQRGEFGRSVVWLEEVASTIDYAQDWLRQGAPHGAVVIAQMQTAGRGRRGRAWASPPGGLWMSVIVRPDLAAESAGRLGIGLAIAAAEAVSGEAGVEAQLKWPNDILLNGRKLGGVLVDAQITSGRVSEAILSTGINVNVAVKDLPEEVCDTAESLLNATGHSHSLSGIAGRLLDKLEALWPSVIGDGRALIGAWRARDALLGREVSVRAAGKMARGRALGIDARGTLALLADEIEHTVLAGEVESVREVQDADPQLHAG